MMMTSFSSTPPFEKVVTHIIGTTTQNFLPIFFGVLAILKVAISPQLQIGVNSLLVEPPTVHEVIQHGCLQRLQPEVKEKD